MALRRLKQRCAEYDLDRVSQITWVPREQIVQAARMMATVKPMGLEWGCAFEQSFNATQTCRAIYMIPAITGNYDVPGGLCGEQAHRPYQAGPRAPDPNLINYYPYRALKPYAHPHQVLGHHPDGTAAEGPGLAVPSANNSSSSLPDSKRVYECPERHRVLHLYGLLHDPHRGAGGHRSPRRHVAELDCVFCK